jgi:RNA polymerase sigma factor (TIGR02999 family)
MARRVRLSQRVWKKPQFAEIIRFDMPAHHEQDGRTTEVTEVLRRWRAGSQEALDELIPAVYSELRRLAQRHLEGERAPHSLQATALTHEVFLRLFGYQRVDWQNRAHFFAMASRIMRRVLVEHARRRKAAKRGHGQRVTLSESHARTEALDIEVLSLHQALSRLEEKDPRQGRVVELRYFGGLDINETAEVVGISPATVKRDWRVAKLWLRRELRRGGSD